MRLEAYWRKRDFKKTREPPPEDAPTSAGWPIFVVRLHHASRRHFDFRLQVGDTLKGRAVPKGSSLDPRVKRLAVEVEDHPIASKPWPAKDSCRWSTCCSTCHTSKANLSHVPLVARKTLLRTLLGHAPTNLRVSSHSVGAGEEAFAMANAQQLEGIVSKRTDRGYRVGRGDDWLKI